MAPETDQTNTRCVLVAVIGLGLAAAAIGEEISLLSCKEAGGQVVYASIPTDQAAVLIDDRPLRLGLLPIVGRRAEGRGFERVREFERAVGRQGLVHGDQEVLVARDGCEPPQYQEADIQSRENSEDEDEGVAHGLLTGFSFPTWSVLWPVASPSRDGARQLRNSKTAPQLFR